MAEEEACLFAMHLASASVLPMVLKLAIELDLLELIATAWIAVLAFAGTAKNLTLGNLLVALEE
ncbi:unnamed protein product [Coffea canephora]|uniref:Uncharacterized protein n=1 Tax=Coffea canephora TaxID=49390 RepID=A0A068V6T3_COFCA|nr:unnamed protein product [Coffea canephora]CDP16376.1 unnamed protein product [Coffea canephora]